MNSLLCALIKVIIGSFQDQMPRISAHIKEKAHNYFYQVLEPQLIVQLTGNLKFYHNQAQK